MIGTTLGAINLTLFEAGNFLGMNILQLLLYNCFGKILPNCIIWQCMVVTVDG